MICNLPERAVRECERGLPGKVRTWFIQVSTTGSGVYADPDLVFCWPRYKSGPYKHFIGRAEWASRRAQTQAAKGFLVFAEYMEAMTKNTGSCHEEDRGTAKSMTGLSRDNPKGNRALFYTFEIKFFYKKVPCWPGISFCWRGMTNTFLPALRVG